GDYQAKCFRMGVDRDPYPNLKGAFTEGSSTNFTRFTHPDIDAALEQLAASTDVEERKQLVEDIMLTVNEHYPSTYSGSTLAAGAVQQHVNNLDGWTFPDGTPGTGVPGAAGVGGRVWTTEERTVPPVLRRAVALVVTLLVVSFLTFGLTSLLPGDPAVQILGAEAATEENVAAVREELRLDDPLLARYVHWLADAVTGDLGRSYRTNQPVAE